MIVRVMREPTAFPVRVGKGGKLGAVQGKQRRRRAKSLGMRVMPSVKTFIATFAYPARTTHRTTRA